ncbi:ATP-dependent DNA helicase RecG [Alicyclobacillus sp. SO9]|uniref:ATP-dependent DNA helicase RecG n=1 Tax=Alicyclobacillus sp. SO9 TaxID=2665646 RepID=UPI0018E8AB6E|nr:ATP-dependent DNA helicase RecG [Alicyclobacillus sp. SO9]QQE80747.1 ATP-dependent DNA helicase RecG [Alicyclobacillus sp. SO9]
MLNKKPVSHVAGVGKVKQQLLAQLGVHTVSDLLHYFPFRYEDRSLRPYEAFVDGDKVAAKAVIQGAASVRWFQRKAMVSAELRIDGVHRVRGIWFNQPYLKGKLTDGRSLVVYGKYNQLRRQIVVEKTEFSFGKATALAGDWIPVYRVVRGLTSQQLQVIIQKALGQYANQLEEILPYELTAKYRLISHQEAVVHMHQPNSEEARRQAHRRLSFEEFFLFQLQLHWYRMNGTSGPSGVVRPVSDDDWRQFTSSLPHELTNAQKKACHDIMTDLQSDRAMARLIQGDVGSGKTWVGLWAAYAVARSGAQTAFMAPTEILVEQHYVETKRRLSPLGLQVGLVTGNTPQSRRNALVKAIEQGEINVVVGTHALLTEDVSFHNLGLVITDEQHRFGVSQRSGLRQKGQTPDVLFLSATPIPRTLAMAVYGDLDVSVLNELPRGRQPIKTYIVGESRLERALRFVRKQLSQGRQVYAVAPLIEDSDELPDILSAARLYDDLRESFAGFTVGLLHGRLPAREKEGIMDDFGNGKIQVLVSTTVIEVGIHVPNATVMMIYHAERFGLAQLHQLRGRVGRGEFQSYCFLVSASASDVAKERLQTMEKTTDGFEIAERDLELRGPGELFGTRQSGLPEFSVGDLVRDFKVMEVAREEAERILGSSDLWLLPQYEGLRRSIFEAVSDISVKD